MWSGESLCSSPARQTDACSRLALLAPPTLTVYYRRHHHLGQARLSQDLLSARRQEDRRERHIKETGTFTGQTRSARRSTTCPILANQWLFGGRLDSVKPGYLSTCLIT